MGINIPTGQDISRHIAIQYVDKAFVYITDCNAPLRSIINQYQNLQLLIAMIIHATYCIDGLR